MKVVPAPDAVFPAPRIAWFVVGSLALINMVSYIERQLPTLLFAPIKKDFSLSDTQVSLLAGFAFVLFYVGFGLLIGRLVDRLNRKRIIAVGVVLWSLATLSCGLARSFAQLFVARVMVGVGEATLGTSASSMLSDYFPRDRLAASAERVYRRAVSRGRIRPRGRRACHPDRKPDAAAGSSPVRPGSRPGKTTFIVVGLFGSLVLLPFIFVREPKRIGVTNREAVHQGVPFSELSAFMKLNWRTLTSHFLAFSIVSTLGFGTVAWMPSYFIRVHHWAAHDIGYVYGIMLAFLGAAGVVAGARFAEWLAGFGYRDVYLRAPLITVCLTAIPASLAPLMPTASAALAVLVVSTFLSSFPVALITAALQIITPNQMRGQ